MWYAIPYPEGPEEPVVLDVDYTKSERQRARLEEQRPLDAGRVWGMHLVENGKLSATSIPTTSMPAYSPNLAAIDWHDRAPKVRGRR